MKQIGIDARMVSSTHGIGRYIQQLAQHLQKVAPDNMEFILFLREDNWGEFETNRENFHKVKAEIDWYSFAEQIKFLNILNSCDLDLVHFPHWNIPVFYQGDFVVTVHDLIMFHFPRPEATTHGRVKYWLKDKIHRLVVKQAVEKSKRIITPSKFTKQDIINTFDSGSDKIEVIYEAPFENSELKDVNITEKFDISNPFVFYIGSAYPHKNLDKLIEAWVKFKEKYDREHQLILAGTDSYFYQKLKDKPAFKQSSSIRHIGEISDAESQQFYQEADLFVFPSKYEGFGLPPLEALRENTPVLTTKKSSLPEILGDSVFYTNANQSTKFAEDIQIALSDSKKRQEKIIQSKNILSNLSWSEAAEKTLKVYQKFI